MDPRFGFLWGTDPETWDWIALRDLVIIRGRLSLYHLPRRHQARVAEMAGERGLLLVRRENQWEVTL
jgi:hypothetical protein